VWSRITSVVVCALIVGSSNCSFVYPGEISKFLFLYMFFVLKKEEERKQKENKTKQKKE